MIPNFLLQQLTFGSIQLVVVFLIVLVLGIDDHLLDCIEHVHLLLVKLVLNKVLEKHQLVEGESESLSRKHLSSSSLDL